jgi:urease accessory protein
MLKATKHIRAAVLAEDRQRATPFDIAVLPHDERHLRRRVLTLIHGDRVLVDFPEPVTLEDRDVLVLEDGRHAEIIAAEEELLEIRGRDPVHLASLAWHIGNRHLAAAIEAERILILRDHVIKAMLEGLGAGVAEIVEPFNPLGGAYANGGHSHTGHSHSHDHGDHHDHHDDGHHHGHAAHTHGRGYAKHRHGQ